MPLWGANTNDESKPKNLTEEEKSRVFADTRGWVITRPDGKEEVLVAIRNLSGGTTTSNVKLGGATIDQVYFRAASYSTGATGVVRVIWNEKVTRTTTGTLVVTQSGTTSTLTATTLGAPTTNNFLDFTFTAPATTGVVLSIGAQTLTLGVNDAGSTTVTSDLTIATADVKIAALAKTGSTSVTTVA
jgi:hypothetical protein